MMAWTEEDRAKAATAQERAAAPRPAGGGEYARTFDDILAGKPVRPSAPALRSRRSVRDYLLWLLEAGAAPGEDWAHADVTALERVIALLDD